MQDQVFSKEEYPGLSASLVLVGLYPLLQLIIVMLMLGVMGVSSALSSETLEDVDLVAYASLVPCVALLALMRGHLMLNKQNSFREIGLRTPIMPVGEIIGWGLALSIAVLGFSTVYGLFFQESGQPELEQILRLARETDRGLSAFIIVGVVTVLGPIVEELIFRGYLQTALIKQTSPIIGIAASSVIFGAVHFNLSILPVLVFIGFALGYLYHKTGSIWPSIAFHILNNSFSVFLFFSYPELF
ncbi:CPBP family intramembrane metalloprotease [Kordiimonas sp. SCSIO 12603]|uniref:CPBP family intramembrane glutamic endopeptidase n=1 Tax=Kordiimonas sp. SCSIO 12603 TaxID=2829596 RepID=UPI0021070633|nr:CPBP family intramembrane glutamic endopeptidase [Kordiimonas sp. SCSIO 12603]UTW57868.1 CPBP family intramembrane metalloprotease [Kordiimonas sp. SCSIO 12603]